jgi:hypothetical protein
VGDIAEDGQGAIARDCLNLVNEMKADTMRSIVGGGFGREEGLEYLSSRRYERVGDGDVLWKSLSLTKIARYPVTP